MSEQEKQETTDRMAEVKAMASVAESLAGLDPEAVARVLRWAVDAYAVTGAKTLAGTATGGVRLGANVELNHANNGTVPKFSDIAELFSIVSPETEADKALVAGYWFQFGEGRQEFGAQEVNTALKHLGRAIKNITGAFDNLKARKPASVMQLKKSGTSRQARKTYKLTHAGKLAVEAMIGQQQ